MLTKEIALGRYIRGLEAGKSRANHQSYVQEKNLNGFQKEIKKKAISGPITINCTGGSRIAVAV